MSAKVLFACSKCFSRHPYEELSSGQQLCKVKSEKAKKTPNLRTLETIKKIPSRRQRKCNISIKCVFRFVCLFNQRAKMTRRWQKILLRKKARENAQGGRRSSQASRPKII